MFSQDTMKDYFSEISGCQLLTKEEEVRLSKQARDHGDISSRNQLIAANLRLAPAVAKRYVRMGLDIQDLIAEGNLGLIKAAQRYDPDRGVRFSTYAVWWIRHFIVSAISNHGKTVRTPYYLHRLCVDWRRSSIYLRGRLGREPLDSEVSEHMGVSAKKAVMIKLAMSAEGSKPASDFEELACCDCSSDPSARMVHQECLVKMMEMIGRLRQSESKVICMHFGLRGNTAKQLREISKEMGVSRQRVQHIMSRGIEKLRKLIEIDT